MHHCPRVRVTGLLDFSDKGMRIPCYKDRLEITHESAE
jgi:hypothetical protein